MGVSERGLRVAMLDSLLQQDMSRREVLVYQMREKQSELTRIQHEQKGLAKQLLVVQRQIASLTDAISMELMQ